MLTTVAIILVLLWALGLVGGQTLGGLIHVILVIALILILFRFLGGRGVA